MKAEGEGSSRPGKKFKEEIGWVEVGCSEGVFMVEKLAQSALGWGQIEGEVPLINPEQVAGLEQCSPTIPNAIVNRRKAQAIEFEACCPVSQSLNRARDGRTS